MPSLPYSVVEAVERAGVRISRMDRRTALIHNHHRRRGEMPRYVGWYWQRIIRKRVVETDQLGPFPCWSAAVADAFRALGLRVPAR